jgi:hypothetical protein
MDYNLKEAAELLDITPRTLLRWNERFEPLLSESTHQAYTVGGSTAPPRYTEADIAILQRAKMLIWQGRSYEQALHELFGERSGHQADDPFAKSSQSPASFDSSTQLLRLTDERPSRNSDVRSEQAPLHSEYQVSGAYRTSWRERFSDRLVVLLAIIITICVIAILVAIRIAW